jgi:hypothetical protein
MLGDDAMMVMGSLISRRVRVRWIFTQKDFAFSQRYASRAHGANSKMRPKL